MWRWEKALSATLSAAVSRRSGPDLFLPQQHEEAIAPQQPNETGKTCGHFMPHDSRGAAGLDSPHVSQSNTQCFHDAWRQSPCRMTGITITHPHTNQPANEDFDHTQAQTHF